VGLSFVRKGKALARDLIAPQDSARWTMNLSAQRDRSANLVFTGITVLQSVGLKLAIITADGCVQEISEGVPVRINLRKGTTQATVQAVPLGTEITSVALQGLRISHMGNHYEMSFAASLNLAGQTASVDLVNVNGQMIWHAQVNLVSGLNSLALPAVPHAGVSLIRLQSHGQTLSTTLVSTD
jgi:hypothetical protein